MVAETKGKCVEKCVDGTFSFKATVGDGSTDICIECPPGYVKCANKSGDAATGNKIAATDVIAPDAKAESCTTATHENKKVGEV